MGCGVTTSPHQPCRNQRPLRVIFGIRSAHFLGAEMPLVALGVLVALRVLGAEREAVAPEEVGDRVEGGASPPDGTGQLLLDQNRLSEANVVVRKGLSVAPLGERSRLVALADEIAARQSTIPEVEP